MKNRLPILLTLLCMCGVIRYSQAQTPLSKTTLTYDTIRIATSNLLNYPGSSDTNNNFKARDPHFRRVEHTMKPDILVVQEMTSQIGVDTFKNHVLNYYQPGLYSTIPFHDGYDSDNQLFYKANKVKFISASYITTDLRDIAEYIVTPIGTSDTIRIYSLHLKASSGGISDTAAENQRQTEATVLRNYLNTLPAGTKFLIVGDFNTYQSSDKGLQKLLESEADNDGRAKDPLNAVGTWNNNSAFRFIHTQSPRVRSFGGGSTGGMDDRFDLMLTSLTSLDNNIIVSHYTSYGNDGNHFNDSINHLPNTAVPDSVANGLHYSADHLPVYCDFRFVVTAAISAFNQLSPSNGAISQLPSGTLTWRVAQFSQSYNVYMDTNNPPTTLVASHITDTTYAFSGLILGTKYYWRIRAQNDSDSLFAANAPNNFTTVDGPAKPTGAAITNIATDSLQLSWTDNATDETGYRVYRSTSASGPYSQVGGDLPADAQSYSDNGLNTDQRYYYHITPFNAIGEGQSAAANATTLAVMPGLPVFSNINYLSMTLTVDPSTNPASTQFAIKVLEDTSVRYVQNDGTLGTGIDWRTFAQWGGGSGMSLSHLHACKHYTASVKARNGDWVETPFTSDVPDSTPCFSAMDTLLGAWNLLSVPVTVTNNYRTAIFPTSASNAYAWETGYTVKDLLLNGVGYWLKFNSMQLDTIPGDPRFSDSIAVKKGWNIIGSSSSLVGVNDVSSNPSGIILSPFFGYNGSTYYITDSIEPMHGYWIKVSQAGKLFLPAPPKNSPKTSLGIKPVVVDRGNLNSFTFEDNAGHRQVLYVGNRTVSNGSYSMIELPPSPPVGSFDVRFSSQHNVELLSGKLPELYELSVLIQSSQYPVKVSWKLLGNDNLTFQWKDNPNTKLEASGSLAIEKNTTGLTLQVGTSGPEALPKEFALHQNYPNPFNPSTDIRYDLPSASQVRLTIFNVLGMQIATLIDSRQEAGFHAVEWQPSAASGTYFYKLEATSIDHPSKTFQQVKRMVLLK